MTETERLLLLVAIGFALGYATGRMIPVLWATRLRWAIQDHTPRRCAECGRWCWTGDTERARHKLAGWVRVCQRCYAEHYKPFSRE